MMLYEGKSCGARAQLSSAGLTKRMTNTRLGINHQNMAALRQVYDILTNLKSEILSPPSLLLLRFEI